MSIVSVSIADKTYFCPVIRACTGFVLLTAFLLQVCAHTVVFTVFKINQAWIAKTLCENRNAPEKKCEGCCHLKKQLAKQDESETPAQPVYKTNLEDYFLHEPIQLPSAIGFTTRSVSFHWIGTLSETLHPAVFHPPCGETMS